MEVNRCCICLEEDSIITCFYKDKIKHIPCNCNVYAHTYCLNKTDKLNCLICKKEYQITKTKKEICCDKCKYIVDKSFTKIKQSWSCIFYNIVTNMSLFSNFKCKCLSFTIYYLLYIITISIICWFLLLAGGYFVNLFCCIFDACPVDQLQGCFFHPFNPLLYISGILGLILFYFFWILYIILRQDVVRNNFILSSI